MTVNADFPARARLRPWRVTRTRQEANEWGNVKPDGRGWKGEGLVWKRVPLSRF